MGSSLLYISIAYYMQKGGGWVQIACKFAYVLNGRPLKGLCERIWVSIRGSVKGWVFVREGMK